jgi:O-antigen/teichoic acid export membrane protein
MLWWQPSAFALVLASLFGAAVTLVGGLGMAGLRRARFTLPREVGREMRRTVGWMLLTFAFSSVLARIDVLLIARWSTIEQVGLFGAAQVFAVIPEMLGLWLAVVFSPRVAPARAQGRLRATMMRIQLALALLVALLALVAWLGVAMAPRFMPSQFVAASPLLLPLLLGAFSGLLLMPFTVPALIFASPRFIFVLDLVTLPLLLFAYHWAIAHSGAVGAAWVSGAGRSIKAVIIQLAAWYRAAPEAPVSSSPSP